MNRTVRMIMDGILALKDRYPHLRELTANHFEPFSCSYEHGVRLAPNPDYTTELEAYERLLREPADPTLKRAAPRPPQKEIKTYEEGGISLEMAWSRESIQGRTAIGMPVPGYQLISLKHYPGEYEARVRGLSITLRIEGKEISALRDEILNVLLDLGAPEMEQGAQIRCPQCVILYPERYGPTPCPLCLGAGRVFQPAQMADPQVAHSIFQTQWDLIQTTSKGTREERGARLNTLICLELYGASYVRQEFGLEGEAVGKKVEEIRTELRTRILELDQQLAR